MNRKWLVPTISVVAILIGLIGIKVWHTYETTEIMEEESIKLTGMTPEQITHIEIRDDRTHIFKKNDAGWENEKYSDLQYDQEKLNGLANEISSMTAYKTIRNIQDLSVYGIHEYARMITVVSKEGIEENFAIGNYIDGENAYYVWCMEQEMLGVVPEKSLSIMTSTMNRWIDGTITLPERDLIDQIVISTPEQTKLEVYQNNGIWYNTKPYQNQYIVSQEAVEAYLDKIQGLTKDSYVTTRQGNEEKYGLVNPSLQIQLTQEFTLKFSKVENGYTYFTYGDEGYIYQIAAEKVKEISEIKPFEWLSKELVPSQQELYKGIEIGYQGKVYKVDFVQSQEGNEEGEASKDHDSKVMNALFAIQLHTPIAQATLEEKNPREAEVTIRYIYHDDKEAVVEFVPYDPSFYLLRSNGTVEFSVEKAAVMEVIKIMNEGIQ